MESEAMNWLNNPNLFMWVITGLFVCSGVRHLVATNWPQVLYAMGAVVLNVAVIMMAAK